MISGKKNHYKILHIDISADPEIVTAAYKKLAKKYHPDKNTSPHCTQLMQEINEAYSVLSDPFKRTQYDKLLESTRPFKSNSSNKKDNTETQRHEDHLTEFHQKQTKKPRNIKLIKLIVIFCIFTICLLFLYKMYTSYSKFINSPSKYIPPKGHQALLSCNIIGKDCNENGLIKIWSNPDQTHVDFLVPPQISQCTAVKQITDKDKKMWWVDCGLSEGSESQIIQGWVPADNIVFTSKNKWYNLY